MLVNGMGIFLETRSKWVKIILLKGVTNSFMKSYPIYSCCSKTYLNIAMQGVRSLFSNMDSITRGFIKRGIFPFCKMDSPENKGLTFLQQRASLRNASRHTGPLNTKLTFTVISIFVVSSDPCKTQQSVCSMLLIFILILGELQPFLKNTNFC